jgi:hypothetical protein
MKWNSAYRFTIDKGKQEVIRVEDLSNKNNQKGLSADLGHGFASCLSSSSSSEEEEKGEEDPTSPRTHKWRRKAADIIQEKTI